MTVTIFASGAAYVWHKGTDITLTNSVVPLLSVVVSASLCVILLPYPIHSASFQVGLILVFRCVL